MNEVSVHKAAPIGGRKVENASILIAGNIEHEMPKDADLGTAGRVFDAEAEQIFIALRDSLPGGTMDRLVGKLLAYKASHFYVSHER